MSLIEQLGGYEKASKHCDKEIKDGGYPYGLISELLEYRRQHNIYEMGDWIICGGELMVFAMQSGHSHGYSYIGYADEEMGQLANNSQFRHATDEEIAAEKNYEQV